MSGMHKVPIVEVPLYSSPQDMFDIYHLSCSTNDRGSFETYLVRCILTYRNAIFSLYSSGLGPSSDDARLCLIMHDSQRCSVEV